MMMKARILTLILIGCALRGAGVAARQTVQKQHPTSPRSMREVNEVSKPSATKTTAIVGAMLIDGRGGAVVTDAVVMVRGEKIVAAGSRAAVPVPKGAE